MDQRHTVFLTPKAGRPVAKNADDPRLLRGRRRFWWRTGNVLNQANANLGQVFLIFVRIWLGQKYFFSHELLNERGIQAFVVTAGNPQIGQPLFAIDPEFDDNEIFIIELL